MPPKARTKVWCKADDDKLEKLIKQPGNGISSSSSKSNVELIQVHWPHRTSQANLKNFQALLRQKLQQFELEGALGGVKRRATAAAH